MKYQIVIFTIFTSLNAYNGIPLDCFPIEEGENTYCFKLSSGFPKPWNHAAHDCRINGGYLATVTKEKTWEKITETILNGYHNYVWLGYKINSLDGNLLPVKDLSDMSKYLTHGAFPSMKGYAGYCVSTYQGKWLWYAIECASSYNYICQYDVKKEIFIPPIPTSTTTTATTTTITTAPITAFKNCQISDIREGYNFKVLSCATTDVVGLDEQVKIECLPGYYQKGSNLITCKEGMWDYSHCIFGCPSPGKKPNAKMLVDKSNYAVGETVVYNCDPNYFSSRGYHERYFTMTCQSDTTWSDEDTSCTSKQEFTISKINISEIHLNIVELKCELTTKAWIYNGRHVRNSAVFTILESGNLLVNTEKESALGRYFCHGEVNGTEQVANHAYEIVSTNACSGLDSFWIRQVTVNEGKNVILVCPQDKKEYTINWYKDEKEIQNNQHQNIIQGVGLFLRDVTLLDEGHYTCQTINKGNNCRYNVTHDLVVIASTETVCGRTGSLRATRSYQPWLAVVYKKDEIACYGTLINKEWVVTSAFCLTNLQSRLNEVYIGLGSSGKHKLEVESIKIHPSYKKQRNPSDIGLVKLQSPGVNFTANIVPVCISAEDIGNIHECEGNSELNGLVAGWGSLSEPQHKLNSDFMGVIAKKKCREANSDGFSEDKFCAEFIGDDESFAGDSGSPFLLFYQRTYFLLGVYTWGDRETRTGHGKYDYFTSVFHHYDWIIENVKN